MNLILITVTPSYAQAVVVNRGFFRKVHLKDRVCRPAAVTPKRGKHILLCGDVSACSLTQVQVGAGSGVAGSFV